jgi:hypothetical protein
MRIDHAVIARGLRWRCRGLPAFLPHTKAAGAHGPRPLTHERVLPVAGMSVRLCVEYVHPDNVAVRAAYGPVRLKSGRSLENRKWASHHRLAHFGLTTFQAVFVDSYIHSRFPLASVVCR